MGFNYGHHFIVSIWGQSHAEALGVTVSGIPAGEPLDVSKIQAFVNRRRPSAAYHTARCEEDTIEVLSGLYHQATCGAPVSLMMRNRHGHSEDYHALKDTPRPAHADYVAKIKYHEANDPRGGGFFSGRMTAPLCMAGAIAVQLLARKGITLEASVQEIGGLTDPESMEHAQQEAAAHGDSLGGLISCTVTGLPVGVGSPFFDSVESVLAHLLFSIPAVKGVSFGSGFELARMRGSQANDPLQYDNDGRVVTTTNHNGGLNGGLTNGMPLTLSVAIKPVPSIALPQQTINTATRQNVTISIDGRHDSCVVQRAVVSVEAAVSIGLIDLYYDYERG